MREITLKEAPLQMARSMGGIGKHHDNHWGRMLVLKLLQYQGARHLPIESASDQQPTVDGITTATGTVDSDMAKAFDRIGRAKDGVLPLSLVYQAQKRGVKVTSSDDMCVYTASYAIRST